jgi:hypothetical protein
MDGTPSHAKFRQKRENEAELFRQRCIYTIDHESPLQGHCCVRLVTQPVRNPTITRHCLISRSVPLD